MRSITLAGIVLRSTTLGTPEAEAPAIQRRPSTSTRVLFAPRLRSETWVAPAPMPLPSWGKPELPGTLNLVLMAEPVIGVLRQNYPEARIAVALREYCAEVLTGHPHIDRLIRCQDKNLRGLKKLTLDIKDFSPDLALLLPNSFRSLIPVRWAGWSH